MNNMEDKHKKRETVRQTIHDLTFEFTNTPEQLDARIAEVEYWIRTMKMRESSSLYASGFMPYMRQREEWAMERIEDLEEIKRKVEDEKRD